MNTSIFVCQHKKYPMLNSDCIVNMHVGKKNSKNNLNLIGDDTGDNISHLNPFFCELTATYWIWKNCKDDIVGLMHYRRFLNLSNDFFITKKKIEQNKINITKENIEAIFNNKIDIVLPIKVYIPPITLRPFKFFPTAYDYYNEKHFIDDLIKVLNIIKQKYPDIYPYAKLALKKHYFYPCNMIITKNEIFDEYSEFIFSVLFDLFNDIQTDVEKRNAYQKRVYGFLSERMMLMYILYKQNTSNVSIKEYPLVKYNC